MTFEEFRELGENNWEGVEVLGDDDTAKEFMRVFPGLKEQTMNSREARELLEKLDELGL